MEIVWWLIVGGLAGWVAGLIMRGGGFGIIANIVIGILGAVLGGLVFGLLGVGAQGFWGAFIVSLIGAVILLAIASLFVQKPTRA